MTGCSFLESIIASLSMNGVIEDYHDFPHLENVTTDLHHDIQTQTGLPLNIEIVAYVGALGAAQHWHRDFPRKVIPEGHHAFAVFFPLNYQLNGNQWIHGSSVGFPVPWVVREMDAGLGDAFVLPCVRAMVHFFHSARKFSKI